MAEEIKIYDFKKPQRYSKDNMRFLSVISEEFCKNISLYIAYELKKSNIHCKLERIEQTNYDEFINMISPDSVIVEHAIQPLVKDSIYQMDKEIALSLIDLMSGGDGHIENFDRELTEIDEALIMHGCTEFITRLYIVEGCEYREISKVHKNAGSSRKHPVSESVLIAHMKMMDGDKEIGKMRFCEPYTCMEPILEQLETKILFRDKKIEYDFEFTNAIYNNVCTVSADIVAKLGETKISVQELLQLQEGDVITLDNKMNEEIEISVSEAKSFRGKPGLVKNKKAIIITDGINKDV